MNTIITLTPCEAQELVDALRDYAISRGWDEEELDDCGVMEEYASVLDVALATLGYEVKVDMDEEEEEEEDTTQYSLTPKGEFVRKYMEEHKEQGVSFEEACEVADILFGESQEEEEEEDMESIIYNVDGRRAISSADAKLLMQCIAKTLHGQFPDLPFKGIEVATKLEAIRIAEAWGIEGVDISEDE